MIDPAEQNGVHIDQVLRARLIAAARKASDSAGDAALPLILFRAADGLMQFRESAMLEIALDGTKYRVGFRMKVVPDWENAVVEVAPIPIIQPDHRIVVPGA